MSPRATGLAAFAALVTLASVAGATPRAPGVLDRLIPRPLSAALFGSDVDAPAFVRESDGLRARDDLGFLLRSGAEVRIAARSIVEVEGQLERAGGDGPVVGRALRAALTWSGERHQFALGLRPFRWGPADGGDLLLGRSARPRGGLAWCTALPLDLPLAPPSWGTWSGDAFLQRLDDDARTIADPLLLGHRFAWQPRPWLELGFARTILFGGEGRTSKLSPRDVAKILFALDENRKGEREASDSDQKGALFGSLRCRSLAGWRDVEAFYVYAGEDALHGLFPSAVAHQLGAGAARGRCVFRAEITETRTGANRWYSHTVYRDAYFHRGLPIGWPYGAGAEVIAGSLGSSAGDWILAARVQDERMEARDGTESHRTRLEGWVSRSLGARDRMELGAELGGSRSHRSAPPADAPLAPLDPTGVRHRIVLAWTHAWSRSPSAAAVSSALLPPSLARSLGVPAAD